MSTIWLHSGEPYIVQPQDEVLEPFHEDDPFAYAGALFCLGAACLVIAGVVALGYALRWW